MPNQNPAYDVFAVDTDALPWETPPQTISAVLAGAWGAWDGEMAATVVPTVQAVLAGAWGGLDGQMAAAVSTTVLAVMDGTWGGLDGQMAATVSSTIQAVLSVTWGTIDGEIVATVIPKIEAVLNGAWGALAAAMSATVIPPIEAAMAGVWGALVGQMFAVPVTPVFTGLQWQMNDGSGWVDIPGETSLSLSVLGYPGGTCFRIVETYDTDGCYDQVTSGILCLEVVVTPPECLQFFYATGEDVEFEVPEGVTSIDALCWGGGYWGGQTFGTIPVTPGETLRFRVGAAATGQAGAYPNGGDGGANVDGTHGAGGSGGTDIFRGATPLMVAGGEGGSYHDTLVSAPAGSGGCAGNSGGTGATSNTYSSSIPTTPNGAKGPFSYWGRGGTQVAGGPGGSGGSPAATAGTLGQGGDGCGNTHAGNFAGGGGGGGYYGGGGGGSDGFFHGSYPAGGGSCYVDGTVTGAFYMYRQWLYVVPCVDGSQGQAVPIITSSDDPTVSDATMLHCAVVDAAGANGLIALRLC